MIFTPWRACTEVGTTPHEWKEFGETRNRYSSAAFFSVPGAQWLLRTQSYQVFWPKLSISYSFKPFAAMAFLFLSGQKRVERNEAMIHPDKTQMLLGQMVVQNTQITGSLLKSLLTSYCEQVENLYVYQVPR